MSLNLKYFIFRCVIVLVSSNGHGQSHIVNSSRYVSGMQLPT